MTNHKIISFAELSTEVIKQLKEQRYMDSTLKTYERTYRRIKEYMERQGVQE